MTRRRNPIRASSSTDVLPLHQHRDFRDQSAARAHPRTARRRTRVRRHDRIPTIVLFEMRYGATKSDRRARSEAGLQAFLSQAVTPWPFEPEDAVHAGDIRAELEKAATPIGHYDYLIAAQARRRDATLVTLNQREFARVPGLSSTDWAM